MKLPIRACRTLTSSPTFPYRYHRQFLLECPLTCVSDKSMTRVALVLRDFNPTLSRHRAGRQPAAPVFRCSCEHCLNSLQDPMDVKGGKVFRRCRLRINSHIITCWPGPVQFLEFQSCDRTSPSRSTFHSVELRLHRPRKSQQLVGATLGTWTNQV